MKRRNLSSIKGGVYFPPDLHIDIIEYKKATTQKEREAIWNKRMNTAFSKLAENTINNYRWDYICKDLDNRSAIQALLGHLVLAIEKFEYDGKKGNAFNYFNLTAKNWCIAENSKLYKHEMKSVEIYPSEYPTNDGEEFKVYSELITYDANFPDLKEFLQLSAKWWKDNHANLFKGKGRKPKWQKVIFALADMMENLDVADITFDKSGCHNIRVKSRGYGQKIQHVNFCRDLRKMTGIPTSHSRHVMYEIEPIQHQMFRHYLDCGSLDDFVVEKK